MSDGYRDLFFDKQEQLLIATKKALELQERVTELEIVLRRIATYQTPDQLRQNATSDYGLNYEEALEMAYENIQQEAKAALESNPRSD